MDSCWSLLPDMKPLKRKQGCIASLGRPGVILSQLWFLLAHLSPRRAATYRLHALRTTCSISLWRMQNADRTTGHHNRLPVSQIKVLSMVLTLARPTRHNLYCYWSFKPFCIWCSRTLPWPPAPVWVAYFHGLYISYEL